METLLTRAITIVALTCILVAGAAATAILGRDSVPAVSADYAAPVAMNPVSNRQAKADKLAVVALATAAIDPQAATEFSEPLRQAYAAAAPADLVPNVTSAPPKPKAAVKPPVQKNYAPSTVITSQTPGAGRTISYGTAYWPLGSGAPVVDLG